jgi:hypothetical protein
MPPKKKVVRKKKVKMKGRGLLDKILDEGKIFGYTIPELHLPSHQFTGPFTKLHKRVDDYGRPITKPFNQVDAIAFQHDMDYQLGVPKREADLKMIRSLEQMRPRNLRERFDRFLIKNIIKGKVKLGLGKKKKPRKKVKKN